MPETDLITYLEKYASFTEQEVEIIQRNIYTEKFDSKSFVLEAGKVCQRIGFIKEGIIRSFYYDDNGNEIVKNFHTVNQFAVDLLSYQKGIPCNHYLQAVNNCQLIFISKTSDNLLSKEMEKWPSLIRKISETLLAEKIEKSNLLFHKDAKERYLYFIENNPEIAKNVPLGYIASYLGIAQQSLSRIRKEIFD